MCGFAENLPHEFDFQLNYNLNILNATLDKEKSSLLLTFYLHIYIILTYIYYNILRVLI